MASQGHKEPRQGDIIKMLFILCQMFKSALNIFHFPLKTYHCNILIQFVIQFVCCYVYVVYNV